MDLGSGRPGPKLKPKLKSQIERMIGEDLPLRLTVQIADQITQLSHRYRSLHHFLGDVLGGERSFIEADSAHEQAIQFELKSDLGLLLSTVQASPRGEGYLPEQILEFLAPYFEAGFLFDIEPGSSLAVSSSSPTSKLRSMFLFGHTFNSPHAEGEGIDLQLPELRNGLIIRGNIQPLLNLLNLHNLPPLHAARLKGASVFAFYPTHPLSKKSSVVVLVCNRPHPWQVDAVEQAYEFVTDLFKRVTYRQPRRGLFK